MRFSTPTTRIHNIGVNYMARPWLRAYVCLITPTVQMITYTNHQPNLRVRYTHTFLNRKIHMCNLTRGYVSQSGEPLSARRTYGDRWVGRGVPVSWLWPISSPPRSILETQYVKNPLEIWLHWYNVPPAMGPVELWPCWYDVLACLPWCYGVSSWYAPPNWSWYYWL